MLILVLLALLIRFWRFSQIPISLYWDEVAIGLDARSILQTGLDLNQHHWLQPLFISYGDYKAPVYIWITTFLGKFFSVSELTIRLPSLLASLGIAIVFYYLVKLLSKPKSKLPLLAVTSFLIMPWSIHFSRIGFESHLSLFWLVLAIFLTVKAKMSKKNWLIIASSLAVCIGIYTYISLRVIAPALFIITYILFFSQKPKKSLLFFAISIVFIFMANLILIRSPHYIKSQQYRISNDNLITSSNYLDQSIAALEINPQSRFNRLAHHRFYYWAKDYLANYTQYFEPHFLFLTGDPNLRHHTGFGGQLLYIQAILLVVGIYALTKQPRPVTWLILAWLALSPTVAALVNETPHASRSIYMIIPLAWFCALGWQQLKPQPARFLLAGLILNLILFAHDYFQHFPDRSSSAWISPYKQVALKLKQTPPNKPVYISDQLYQPELYFHFYLNDLNLLKKQDKIQYFLPETCPENAICIGPPNWQINYD